MRILFLNYEYPPLGGGAGNASEFLLHEFSRDDSIEIDAVVSAADNRGRTGSVGNNIRIHRLAIGDKRHSLKSQSIKDLLLYAWKASKLCARLVRENHYDGVHVFFTVPCGAVAWYVQKRFHLPYIVSLRGSDVPGYSQKYKKLYFFIKPIVREIWKRSVKIVSNSEGLKKLALQTDPKRDIDVIYNGVDTQSFPPRQTRSDKEFRILCASRLEKRKGFRYAIESVALLQKRHPFIRLTIAGGDGNAGEELRALVREKNLEATVFFSGQYNRKKLSKLQSESDVFVLPSFNEGMSNSLLEAMAGGLPVIMTPTGGAEELITEGENGWIVPFADANALAEKLEIFCLDPQQISVMGERSRQKAESMQWSRVAREYHRLYASKFTDSEHKTSSQFAQHFH